MAKPRTYTASFNFDFNGESLYDGYTIECRYVVHKGSPQTRDDPGSPAFPEVLVVGLWQDAVSKDGVEVQPRMRLDLPSWLTSLIEVDEGLLQAILAHDAEIEAADRDHAAEMRADEDREERWSWRQGQDQD